ncbi:MAG TPA: hypothetical protein VF786_05305 [Terriglobales bacterium]
MTANTSAGYWRHGGRGELLLWAGILAGPLAWGFDLGTSYAVTQHVCSTGHYYLLHLICVVALVFALAGFFSARTAYREIPAEADHEQGGLLGHSKFLALCGQASSLTFAVVVIAGAVPRWVLPPCM